VARTIPPADSVYGIYGAWERQHLPGILPVAKKHRVAAINWGLVVGKTQTNLPWDSWQKPYTDRQPAMWHHEIFRLDGTPYREDEVAFIREMTAAHTRPCASSLPRRTLAWPVRAVVKLGKRNGQ